MGKDIKEKRFIVYEHLFPNGKRYFGITSKKPNQRWENGGGYSKEHQPVVYNAIKKYGWDNIKHNILFTGLTYEEATEMEIKLIAQYKTNCSRYGNDYGYNMTDGGEGAFGHTVTEDAKKKISETHFGKRGKDCKNSKSVICDGVEYESLTAWREAFNYPKGNVNGWLNGTVAMPIEWYEKRMHYKEKGFDIVKCQDIPHTKMVKMDGLIFNSQAELAKYLHIAPATVCLWFNGKHRVPQDIIDRGLSYVEEDNVSFTSQIKAFRTPIQYDGKIFCSQAELAKFLNINKATLNSWLLGKNKMPKEMIEKGLQYIK